MIDLILHLKILKNDLKLFPFKGLCPEEWFGNGSEAATGVIS